jgi:hypothetical protein
MIDIILNQKGSANFDHTFAKEGSGYFFPYSLVSLSHMIFPFVICVPVSRLRCSDPRSFRYFKSGIVLA